MLSLLDNSAVSQIELNVRLSRDHEGYMKNKTYAKKCWETFLAKFYKHALKNSSNYKQNKTFESKKNFKRFIAHVTAVYAVGMCSTF